MLPNPIRNPPALAVGRFNFLLLEGFKRLSRHDAVDLLVANGVWEFLDWLDKAGGLRGLVAKKSAKRLLENAAC